MNILSSMGNFLLSEWLWSITFDWYHIPISLLLCGISFRWVLRIPLKSSFLLALLSGLYALCIFAFFIVVVLLYLFNFSYSATWVPDPFHACFYLGLIFAVLQTTFYFIVHRWYRLNMPGVIFLTFLSNSTASIITYYLLLDPLM
ncbi:MAG: hypothetical protein P4L31_04060 [Candidatus Babeliales bacterium]|nr:hypothetical protein [Candidatus Babeliales bacterium]